MSKTDSQRIGRLGETIFAEIVESHGWDARRQDPDYKKDFIVEIFDDNGNPEGIHATIQVKTSSKLKEHSQPKWKIETADLVYLNEKTDLPSFVVIVDQRSRRGWWMSVEECVAQLVKRNPNWNSQESVTIKFDTENAIDNKEKFRSAIASARIRLRERRPCSIDAAINHDVKEWKALDPRFDIKLNIIDQHYCYYLTPKEEVHVKTIMRGEASTLNTKVFDLLGMGKAVDFKEGEIAFEGSAVFERILELSGGSLTIKHGWKRTGYLDLYSCTRKSRSVRKIEHLTVKLEGGNSGFSFDVHQNSCPLSMNSEVKLATQSNPADSSLSLTFDIAAWIGLPLLSLPWFKQLFEFFSQWKDGGYFSFDIWCDGSKIFTPTKPATMKGMTQIRDLLNLLHKARYIANRLNMNPVLLRMDRQVAFDIEKVYSLLTRGSHIERQSGLELTFSFGISQSATLLEAIKNGRGKPAPLTVRSLDAFPFKFMGEEVTLGPVDLVINECFVNEDNSSPTTGTSVDYRNFIAKSVVHSEVKYELRSNYGNKRQASVSLDACA